MGHSGNLPGFFTCCEFSLIGKKNENLYVLRWWQLAMTLLHIGILSLKVEAAGKYRVLKHLVFL